MTEKEYLDCKDPGALLRFLTDTTVTTGGFSGHPPAGTYGNPLRPSDRKLRLWCFAQEVQCRGLESARHDYNRWEDGEPDLDDGPDDHLPVNVARDWVRNSDPTITPLEQCNLFREIVGNPFRSVTLPESITGETLVRELVHAAYEERGRKCLACNRWTDCKWCGNTRRIDNGTLDPARLAVLSDALEEAGCPTGLTCERCKGRGKVAEPPGMEAMLEAEADEDVSTLSGCWVVCSRCMGKKTVPHPILAHLRIGPSTTHSSLCGVVYRGCAPDCAKDIWERNGPHVRGCWALDCLLGEK